jgi:hypothetical protein
MKRHATISTLHDMNMKAMCGTNAEYAKLNCIVFLDVRKAFDSINQEILIDKMRNFFGVTGNQLRWFESYLNNRVQQYLINGQLYRAQKR